MVCIKSDGLIIFCNNLNWEWLTKLIRQIYLLTCLKFL